MLSAPTGRRCVRTVSGENESLHIAIGIPRPHGVRASRILCCVTEAVELCRIAASACLVRGAPSRFDLVNSSKSGSWTR